MSLSFPIVQKSSAKFENLLKMSHLNFPNSAFFTNFYLIQSDLSGNTGWPDFQTIFGIFLHSRYIGSSLCSQYFQMRLLERFSNTMKPLFFYYSETGGGFSGKLPANIAEIASSWTRGGFLQLIVILTSSITNHTVSEYLKKNCRQKFVDLVIMARSHDSLISKIMPTMELLVPLYCPLCRSQEEGFFLLWMAVILLLRY